MPKNHLISFSPDNNFHMLGADSMGTQGKQEPYILKELAHHRMGPERKTCVSSNIWEADSHDFTLQSYLLSHAASSFMRSEDQNGSLYQNDIFSRSLSDILATKLRLLSNDVPFHQPVDRNNLKYEEDEPLESMEDIEAQTIGNLLPDDDDLLSVTQPNSGDNTCNDGGIELGGDANTNGGQAHEIISEGASNDHQGGLDGSVDGEHIFAQRPSRTLFIRNISSNSEDSELRALFEQYGDIQMIYTACKDRGFVMISYYDTRAAEHAFKALQNKTLMHQKLDIHYSIPKDYLSGNNINQGILAVFNLDSSVSNHDLSKIFGDYGEIKEIFATPHKLHQRFIEFYDIRDAEAALHALNKSRNGSKRFEHESSHLGEGRSLAFLFFPPGSASFGTITSNGLENGAMHSLHSAICAAFSPLTVATNQEVPCTIPQSFSSKTRVASVGTQNNQASHADLSHPLRQINCRFKGTHDFHPQLLPEFHSVPTNGISYNSSNKELHMDINVNTRPADGTAKRCHYAVGFGSLHNHCFENSGNAIRISGDGSSPFHGPSYVRNDSNKFHHQPPVPMLQSSSLSFTSNPPCHHPIQSHGLSRAQHMLNEVLSAHNFGSAYPVNQSLWDMQHGYAGDCTHQYSFPPGSSGSMGFSGSSQLCRLELPSRSIFPRATANCMSSSASHAHVATTLPQERCQLFHGKNPMIPIPGSVDTPSDRYKRGRNDAKSNQADDKKQHELDIGRILHSEDSRTTLMIKNIPNKYTSKMLLAAIDENHRGTYDFIYLPIDFKNKCNVGYAFINMTKSQHIIPFYQSFNGKKWEKFNSEKVASLAYARIQGKAALIAHFQNSSLMNEDKRFRPILFYSDGPHAGEQEPFPVGVNIRSRSRRSRSTSSVEDNRQGSPATNENVEDSCGSVGSVSEPEGVKHATYPAAVSLKTKHVT
ncbi:hypothetical protein Cni_G21378 [Canna indica]|uniref:RRM domain-containing protein n=1 Tax=Canna indica TaxID=4628 RepID=A0AAQ3KUT6_9LILI|nr:hypothetical protein Cni_G21378 [Canna indica]